MKKPFFGDISAFQTRNCQKPVDTPLRETVPRSALTMGVDDLFRAVFFRHVRKAAVPIQDARGRVVEEHDEAGIEAIWFMAAVVNNSYRLCAMNDAPSGADPHIEWSYDLQLRT